MDKSFDTITETGATDYLSSFIEDMEDKISNNHADSMLYKEAVLFLSKSLEMSKELIKTKSQDD